VDHLWTPWRYAYVTESGRTERRGIPDELSAWPGDKGCVFCNMLASVDYAIANGMSPETAEAAAGIVLRAPHCFICLNRYPYTAGHIMVLPNEHQASLAALDKETANELMDLAQKSECALAKAYTPDGYNFGLNLGRAAGAGVTGHLHLHAMPRWVGDTNFMTVVSETRILPEDFGVTWKRMREAFASIG
jgi:ATP adenylyltransferase